MKDDKINWFKSTYSGNQDTCVETSVDLLPSGKVPVRDSKNLDANAPIITVSASTFASFVGSVKGGSFDTRI
ncbi:DUF397 domain-containing protein [Staphylococcus pasteuri]|uniref:DUF397 domain-containing protein n=1 Tax=Staphylococcus pasteuri TaxID=45972 RepID=UPI0036FC3E4A